LAALRRIWQLHTGKSLQVMKLCRNLLPGWYAVWRQNCYSYLLNKIAEFSVYCVNELW